MSKKCRIVNGGGSAEAVDQPVAPKSRRVHPPSTNETIDLKKFNLINSTAMIMKQFHDDDVKAKETISELKKRLEFLKQELAKYEQSVDEDGRNGNLNVLPFKPVSSTCSSSMGDLSSAEQHNQQEEQQDVKPKRRRKPLNKISVA